MATHKNEEELTPLRCLAERPEHFPRAPACRGGAYPDEGSVGSKDARAHSLSRDDARDVGSHHVMGFW